MYHKGRRKFNEPTRTLRNARLRLQAWDRCRFLGFRNSAQTLDTSLDSPSHALPAQHLGTTVVSRAGGIHVPHLKFLALPIMVRLGSSSGICNPDRIVQPLTQSSPGSLRMTSIPPSHCDFPPLTGPITTLQLRLDDHESRQFPGMHLSCDMQGVYQSKSAGL